MFQILIPQLLYGYFFNTIGQTPSFGDVCSMSGLTEGGHGWAILRVHAGSRKGALDNPANSQKASDKTFRKSGQDDQDKFSLPTCFGFSEDILEAGARRFVTDVEFDCGGSKCFSRDEMKCQSSLSWRQAKVRPQLINGLVHDEVRDGLRRHVVGAAALGGKTV